MGGFNRNILECKQNHSKEIDFHGSGINRNILECKHFFSRTPLPTFCINRNMLECKFLKTATSVFLIFVLIETEE